MGLVKDASRESVCQEPHWSEGSALPLPVIPTCEASDTCLLFEVTEPKRLHFCAGSGDSVQEHRKTVKCALGSGEGFWKQNTYTFQKKKCVFVLTISGKRYNVMFCNKLLKCHIFFGTNTVHAQSSVLLNVCDSQRGSRPKSDRVTSPFTSQTALIQQSHTLMSCTCGPCLGGRDKE